MAWLGQKVVLCTSLRYMLLHPTQGTTTQPIVILTSDGARLMEEHLVYNRHTESE